MMDKEGAYEYIEESDKRAIMELLDSVVNRFRELYADRELIVLSLPKGPGSGRTELLERAVELIRKYEQDP